jgi:hypothetical protein
MPALLLIAVGFVGGLIAWLMREVGPARASSSVGIGAEPQRPPLAYVGDEVFSLPQVQWGKVERVRHLSHGGGCVYGVRFPDGQAVVLGEGEIGECCSAPR